MLAYLKFQLKVMIQLVLQYKAQSRQLEINSSGIKSKVRSWNEKNKNRVQIITPAISLQLSFDGCHDMGIEMSCSTVHTHLLIMLLHMRSVH